MGYSAVALAIDLSQWGYEVTLYTDRKEQAEEDLKGQAGMLTVIDSDWEKLEVGEGHASVLFQLPFRALSCNISFIKKLVMKTPVVLFVLPEVEACRLANELRKEKISWDFLGERGGVSCLVIDRT
jgi:hypothetical protein